jgi:hypothetical protein
MSKREMLNRWISMQRSQLTEQFPDNLIAVNAGLVGILQSKLEDMMVGGSAREIAIEMIEESVHEF